MKKNGIALAIILIILVLTLVACGENDLGTCDHNVVIDEAVSATCTEKGLTEGEHCSKCGEVLLAQTEVPALGHTAADAVKENEIEPTCTTAGSYDSVVYCSVCDVEISRETKSVDALDHNIVNHNAQAPTCTEVGWEAYETCSRCDHTTYVEIPATGHNFENNESCLICSAEYYTEGLQFSLCKDEYTVTGIITSASDVTIPSTYQGLPVTEIATNAFYECTSLTSIVIPDSVTTIGDRAFYGCSSLTSVTMGDSVTSIGELAFSGSNVTEVYYNGDVAGWCGITFGDSSANPVYYADNLYIDGKLVEGELVIPDSVTTIPIYAFRGCAVTSVTFGNESQLTAIDSHAFAFCKSLTSVTIPDGVTSIGNNAFLSCNNLTSVTFGNESQLTAIDNYAFAFCYGLTGISIPNKVTNIGESAFKGCANLKNINIPAGITSIGVEAFQNCLSLKTIFNYSSLDIVAGETTHGYIAEYADHIYDMTGDATLTEDEDGFVIYTKGNVCELVEYKGDATDVVIPDGITAINNRAFYDNDTIAMVFIPASVKSIGDYAVYECNSLTSVAFDGDSQLTTIGSRAFCNCYSLTSIIIPDGVTTINDHAFYGCRNLTSITIPDSVTSIGDYAFESCFSLTNVMFGNDSQLLEIGSFAFAYCHKISVFNIPAGVINIDDCAFYYCDYLSSVTIPAGMTSIGVEAFRYCNRLKSIYNYSTLDIVAGETTHGYIAEYADHIYDMTGDATLTEDEDGFVIYTKGNVCELVEYKGDATDVVIPDGITAINCNAFYENDTIETVYIPNGVTKIGDYVFSGCDSLRSVNIPDGVTFIGEGAFDCCFGLTSIAIPASVTSIGSYAFSNCSSVTVHISDIASWCNVSFGNETANPLYHGRYLYIDEIEVIDLVIPDGVTNIGDYAFYNCDSLTSITIPDSVTTIGGYAFHWCDSLTDVYYEGTEEEWNSIAIGSDNYPLTNATIHYNYVNE